MAVNSRTGKRFKKTYRRYLHKTLSPAEGSLTPGDPSSDLIQNIAQKHEVAWFTAAESIFGPGTQAIGSEQAELGQDFENDLLADLGSEYSVEGQLLRRALTIRDTEREVSQARMTLHDCLEGRIVSRRRCAEVVDSTRELLVKVKAEMDANGATHLLRDIYQEAEAELGLLEDRLGSVG